MIGFIVGFVSGIFVVVLYACVVAGSDDRWNY
jgi:hypothetical protein